MPILGELERELQKGFDRVLEEIRDHLGAAAEARSNLGRPLAWYKRHCNDGHDAGGDHGDGDHGEDDDGCDHGEDDCGEDDHDGGGGYLHAPLSGLPGNPLQKEGGVLVPRPME